MDNTSNTSIFDLTFETESRSHLIEIAKWSKLLSITGIVAGSLLAILGLIVMFVGPSLSDYFGSSLLGYAGIIYVFAGLLYIFPSIKLLRFATQMPVAFQKSDQALVNEALGNLKSVFKFWGILTLIVIALYAIVLLLVTLFGAFS